MKLLVRHETVYHLNQSARRSCQYLRLTPRRESCQRVVRWRVNAPGKMVEWRDGYGNGVHAVSRDGQHDEICIRIEGVVETRDTMGILSLSDGLPPALFTRNTALTAPDSALKDFAASFAEKADRDTISTLHELMRAVGDAVSYLPGVTDVSCSAAEALAHGRGVCQDHAHVFITLSRLLGIPCRYVSGYLYEGTGAGASHAWAEAHVDGLGWVSFDPANQQSATAGYIRLAVGLDYVDAAPIIGLRTGGEKETMAVSLQVEQHQA